MSTRNETEERILDAAADCLQRTGRLPIAEVARHAGVSRPTVYRRFADSDAVLRALWHREIDQLLAGMRRDVSDRRALVTQAVRIAEHISTHDVLAATFHTDAGLLSHYIVDRLGAGQRALLQVLREAIAQLQSGGTVRRGKPVELAAMVLLIAQSAIQSRDMIAEQLPPAAWRRELTRALDAYLAP